MHDPFVIWIMGPTSSGKTTLAERLTETLRGRKRPVLHFDGDEVRDFFPRDMGFAPEDRMRVVDVICQLANKCVDGGVNVVVSALTANQAAREHAFSRVRNLYIVYIDCPIETCIERDPKGLYRRAMSGEIDTLIGYNTPYVPPCDHHLAVDTSQLTPDQAVEVILAGLKRESPRNPA